MHPIFIIYLGLNGFGTLLDGSPLTLVCLLKCEKWYISKLNLTFFHFFSSFSHSPPLQHSPLVTQGLFVKTGPKNCTGIITTIICVHTDRGGVCVLIAQQKSAATTASKRTNLFFRSPVFFYLIYSFFLFLQL